MKRFFNILFLIVFVLIFSSSVYAKDVKFIQVTDLHFDATQGSIENFNNLIEQINKIRDLDFVVFTGDNIDSAKKRMLNDFLKIAKKIDVPYYIEIGNHDCFKAGGLSKAEYRKMVNKSLKRNHKDFNFVKKQDKLVFLFIDGVKEIIPAHNGYYNSETLQWLEKQLDKYKNKKVIIFQHFPLMEERPNSNHNLFRPEQYFEIISKHDNILAIFAGHYHSPNELNKDGVLYYISGSAHGKEASYREVYIEDLGNNKYEFYTQIVNFKEWFFII